MGLWSLPPPPFLCCGEPRGGSEMRLRILAAGGRTSLTPSPEAGKQRRFNLAFMCHGVSERVLLRGANVKHLDGGRARGGRGGGGRRVAARRLLRPSVVRQTLYNKIQFKESAKTSQTSENQETNACKTSNKCQAASPITRGKRPTENF